MARRFASSWCLVMSRLLDEPPPKPASRWWWCFYYCYFRNRRVRGYRNDGRASHEHCSCGGGIRHSLVTENKCVVVQCNTMYQKLCAERNDEDTIVCP